jgi:serine/threonine protein kinase
MSRPAGLGQLKTNEWQQLQEFAGRFEEAWQKVDSGATAPDLRQFLPAAANAVRLPILHELIKTELEIRWRRGLPTQLENYLDKFPELGPVQKLPAELICEEYRVRHRHGDKPSLQTYQQRFPGQFAEVQKLMQQQPLPTQELPTQTLPGSPAAGSPAPTAPGKVTLRPGAADLIAIGTGYKMLQRIGSGTFGEVWQAEAPGGVPVAIKMLIRPVDHAEAKRELQSLELIKRLHHPFLLQTQAYAILEDRLLIVMELADGSLRDRVKKCRQQGLPGIPLPELYRYFRESSEALDFLHSEKVLHRDIKPENILILKGHAKVADFGLARGQAGSGHAMVSATGCGTPAYMAPEVWRGKVSEHTDQYSLAMAYAELRLHRRLFPDGDFMSVMLSHVEKTPDLAPLAQPEQEVVLRALAKDPSKRFPDCMEFANALHEAVGHELGVSKTEFSTASMRQGSISGVPSGSRQSTDALGTVGRSPLPARPGTSGGPTEKIGWRAPEKQSSRRTVFGVIVLLALIAGGAFYFWRQSQEKPISPEPLPPDAVAAPDATLIADNWGKHYYSKILKGDSKLPFVLVPSGPNSGVPQSFYIMENKVSIAQFKKFAEVKPEDVKNKEWLTLAADDTFPVLDVSVEDAHRFAKWVGGKLPTTLQWDSAAGRYVKPPRIGPYNGFWWEAKLLNGKPDQIAVGLEKPMPVGQAAGDISPTGCKDMSGNGREWTDNLRGQESRRVYNADLQVDDWVLLRGRSFNEDDPLRFKDIEDRERSRQVYDAQEALKPDLDIGFRVVIEP